MTISLDEIQRQRRIGKQLMVVDIIRCENEHAGFSGFSFVSIDDISEWASMEKEEIEMLFDYCRNLDPFHLAFNVANNIRGYTEFTNERNVHFFIVFSCKRYGRTCFLASDEKTKKQLYEKLAAENYNIYCEKYSDKPVSDIFCKPEIFAIIMKAYENHFIALVKNAIKDGYNRDVINRMAGFEIPTWGEMTG